MNKVILNNTPLFYLFAELLCASSILSLRQVNARCYTLSEQLRQKKIMTHRVNQALRQRGLDCVRFNQALIASQCKLSGSFILQAINNEPWVAKDLDLYTLYDTPKHPTDITVHGGNCFTPIDDFLWDLTGQDAERYWTGGTYFHDFREPTYINRMFAYRINPETVVQCMQLETDIHSIEQFIQQRYDLRFLKNTFDGHSVTLFDSQSICKRESNYYVNVQQGEACHIHRALKYQQRGYRISNLQVQLLHSSEIRLCQYVLNTGQNLGYAIHIDDISKALTLPAHKQYDFQPRFTVDQIPNFRQQAPDNRRLLRWLPVHYIVDENYMNLEGLFGVIRSQISISEHTEEHQALQDHLNTQFAQYYRFQYAQYYRGRFD